MGWFAGFSWLIGLCWEEFADLLGQVLLFRFTGLGLPGQDL